MLMVLTRFRMPDATPPPSSTLWYASAMCYSAEFPEQQASTTAIHTTPDSRMADTGLWFPLISAVTPFSIVLTEPSMFV